MVKANLISSESSISFPARLLDKLRRMEMQNALKLACFTISILLLSCTQDKRGGSEWASEYPHAFEITAENKADLVQNDAVVVLSIVELKAKHQDFNPHAFIILDKNQEVPSQTMDNNADGTLDELAFLANFDANEARKLTVRYAASGKKTRDYRQRAQAELSRKFGGEWQGDKYIGGSFQNVNASGVRNWQTDHTEFFRYEGPGWESDKIGYRFYLDWRNAIDIYGKKTTGMVLQNVGLDGYDSYHEMADWGMDVLKVGESLGIGSIGMWVNDKAVRINKIDSIWCEIVASGPIYAQIRTNYYGWDIDGAKIDLVSNLSIAAGSRMTKHSLAVRGNLPNLCTGLVKEKGVDYFASEQKDDGEWQYIANYGKQSLAGDLLGMAVLYRQADLLEQAEDELSRVVVLQPNAGKLDYYFLAAWEKEPNGITSKEEFIHYLDEVLMELDRSITVSF